MAATAAVLAVSGTALSQEPRANMQGNAEALARAAQNPIAAMISVPFQNNVNFGSVAKITAGHDQTTGAVVQAAIWNSPAMKLA